MKCECFMDKEHKIPCSNEAEFVLIGHSNIYAGLYEVECPEVRICKKHKDLIESDPRGRDSYKEIVPR